MCPDASLDRLHGSLCRRFPRARDADKDSRGRAERTRDRIRVARRSEISQSRARGRLRADAFAQRIYRATPGPAEGIVALTNGHLRPATRVLTRINEQLFRS